MPKIARSEVDPQNEFNDAADLPEGIKFEPASTDDMDHYMGRRPLFEDILTQVGSADTQDVTGIPDDVWNRDSQWEPIPDDVWDTDSQWAPTLK